MEAENQTRRKEARAHARATSQLPSSECREPPSTSADPMLLPFSDILFPPLHGNPPAAMLPVFTSTSKPKQVPKDKCSTPSADVSLERSNVSAVLTIFIRFLSFCCNGSLTKVLSVVPLTPLSP